MIQAVPLLLGFILATGPSIDSQPNCRIQVAEPQLCVHTSLLVTIHCRNESPGRVEWLEADDRRALWELTRPDGSSETAYRSRYSVSHQRLELPPGKELIFTAPLTRWFEFPDAASYRLRFRLLDRSGSTLLETNEESFSAIPCDAEAVLAACRVFIKGKPADLEAVGGFSSEAALPCMEEALARSSTHSGSIIDGLARINTANAVVILLTHFYESDAFDRLAVWQALHKVDTSHLSADLRERVNAVLKKQPISVKDR